MTKRQYFPALRGVFGDWAYYSCLMSLREIAERVNFADRIHKSKALSELIQRKLKEKRAEEICNYLTTNSERFFNSMVVAVYGGDPAWHALDEIKPQADDFNVDDISLDAIASLGFLSFSGAEKLFMLDGQHRLAGIQKALLASEEVGEDEVSVIFVSHRNNQAGMRRTRALFTTLNKTAKAINKSEIIALDEADAMAIVTRRLIEIDPRFSEERILVTDSRSLPNKNTTHLTMIQNLYDVLTILFSKVMQKRSIKELSFQRPKDSELDAYYDFAIAYFEALAKAAPELHSFFKAKNAGLIVPKYRNDGGGSVLFRPVGQTMFALVVAELCCKLDLKEAMSLVAKLPRELSSAPYVDLLWDKGSGTINLKRAALVRRILLYMLGKAGGNVSAAQLRKDIASVTGEEASNVELPDRIE